MHRREIEPSLFHEFVINARVASVVEFLKLLSSSIESKWEEKDDAVIMERIRLVGENITFGSPARPIKGEELVVKSKRLQMSIGEMATAHVGFLFSKLSVVDLSGPPFGSLCEMAARVLPDKEPAEKAAKHKEMRSELINTTHELRRIHAFQELVCGGQEAEQRTANVLAAVSVFFEERSKGLSLTFGDCGVDLQGDAPQLVPYLALARVLIAIGIIKTTAAEGAVGDNAPTEHARTAQNLNDVWKARLALDVTKITPREKNDFGTLFREHQLCWASPLCARTVRPRLREKIQTESTPQQKFIDDTIWSLLNFDFKKENLNEGLEQLRSLAKDGDSSLRGRFLLEISKVVYFLLILRPTAQLHPLPESGEAKSKEEIESPWLNPERSVFLFWQDLGEPRFFDLISKDKAFETTVSRYDPNAFAGKRHARLPLIIQTGWRSWLVYDRDKEIYYNCQEGFFEALATFWVQADTVPIEERSPRDQNYLVVVCKAMKRPVAGMRQGRAHRANIS